MSIGLGAMGQILPCLEENDNIHDPYTVAVINDGAIVDIYFEQFLKHFLGNFLGKTEWEIKLDYRWWK